MSKTKEEKLRRKANTGSQSSESKKREFLELKKIYSKIDVFSAKPKK